MAAPTVASGASTSDASAASTLCNAPSGVTAGDLLMAFESKDCNGSAQTVSASTGWTDIMNTADVGDNVRGACFARIADGGANDTLTLSSSGTDDVAVRILRITGHGVTDVSTDIAKGTPATGASTTPDPPSANGGSAQDWLAIAMAACDDDDELVSGDWQPSGYTQDARVESAQSASATMVMTAYKALSGATTEDPGVFTQEASEQWVTQTFLIPPSGGGGEPPATGWGKRLGMERFRRVRAA